MHLTHLLATWTHLGWSGGAIGCTMANLIAETTVSSELSLNALVGAICLVVTVGRLEGCPCMLNGGMIVLPDLATIETLASQTAASLGLGTVLGEVTGFTTAENKLAKEMFGVVFVTHLRQA